MTSSKSFLISRQKAALLIIDIQGQLFKAMPEHVGEQVVRNIRLLTAAATKLELPVVVTEQYPQGLGPTLPEIRQDLAVYDPIAKVTFSSWREPAFAARLQSLGVESLILTGMEAHICCLQTALDLCERHYRVYLAADAVCSRRKMDWQMGLDWMRQAGVVVSTTESLVFQLLERADTDAFRSVLPLIKS